MVLMNRPSWQEEGTHQPTHLYSAKAQEAASGLSESQKCLLLGARISGSAFCHKVGQTFPHQGLQKATSFERAIQIRKACSKAHLAVEPSSEPSPSSSTHPRRVSSKLPKLEWPQTELSIEQGETSGPELPLERTEEAGAGPGEKQAMLLRVGGDEQKHPMRMWEGWGREGEAMWKYILPARANPAAERQN